MEIFFKDSQVVKYILRSQATFSWPEIYSYIKEKKNTNIQTPF